MIRAYLSNLLLQAMAEVCAADPTWQSPDPALLEARWRRPRLAHQCDLSLNVKAFISPDNLPKMTADLAGAMLRLGSDNDGLMLASVDASGDGFISCFVGAELAARALCACFSQGSLAADAQVPALLALPTSYERCQAYLRHAKEPVVDILSARQLPALIATSEWSALNESWRSDYSVFLPLFKSDPAAPSALELVVYLSDFAEGLVCIKDRGRLGRKIQKIETLLERFFAACAADKGFFGDDLSVSKARLGLIFAVMHVTLLGLGIMHLSTAE